MIDVHHHFEPAGTNTGGGRWSVDASLDEMDRNGIALAIGYGGPVFADRASGAHRAAREINDWAADLARTHTGRFGLFASVPMNDVDAALEEIAHAFDALGADGVGIAPRYGSAWLGDVRFAPIFAELDRRAAIVYVHPARGSSSAELADLNDPHGIICAPWIEYPADTARTMLSLWAAGTTRRFPNIRFLFCHGGGVMPLLLGRFAGFSAWPEVGPERLASIFPDGVYAAFAAMYFELAQAYAPETVTLLRSIVPDSHLLFGTDYSYFPIAHSVEQFGRLPLADVERRAISSGNAVALFSRRSHVGSG